MLNKNSRVHLVGIGGIGMSGLAQLLVAIGCKVSGSDRDSSNPVNKQLFDNLIAQNIAIFPQDGSYINEGSVDVLIYSTAVEEGNPDFQVAGSAEMMHRSIAVEQAIALYGENKLTRIAVAGSSGKTSVTAYLAELLEMVDGGAACLNGGMVGSFIAPPYPGNFHSGDKYFVFEVDESDKSLVNYKVDYAIILNIGHDHYSIEELIAVFGEFSKNVSQGLVVSKQVRDAIQPWIPAGLKVITIGDQVGDTADDIDFSATEYTIVNSVATAKINNQYSITLPQAGEHTALNMSFVAGMLTMLNFNLEECIDYFPKVKGAARRFDLIGVTKSGVPVYDDYAHNPEKLACSLQTAQSLSNNRVLMFWQPHGYGPLKFMTQHLASELLTKLRSDDIFILMEPFYAGGTSSFSPHASDVIGTWRETGVSNENIMTLPDRHTVARFFKENAKLGDVILVCGARDNTIPVWCSEIIKEFDNLS